MLMIEVIIKIENHVFSSNKLLMGKLIPLRAYRRGCKGLIRAAVKPLVPGDLVQISLRLLPGPR